MISNPSNATIMEALGELTGEMKAEFKGIRRDLTAVKEQTTKTNGRVNALEQKASNAEAVAIALDKAHLPTIGHADKVVMEQGWTTREKALIGIITSVIALALAAIGAKAL